MVFFVTSARFASPLGGCLRGEESMWYFSSPKIIFGEGALSHLATLRGERAALVTDANLVRLGLAQRVLDALLTTGMSTFVYDAVEPDPDLDSVRAGADELRCFAPHWIIALGGGSVMDAAKGMWVLYERPDIDPGAINPVEELGLRAKARFVAIPTTSGSGSEASWGIVLTDPLERRKLGLGSREALPDIAILDPELVAELPARLTADTGLDALVHAVEGFTSAFHNDFTDGLCLHAARLVFDNLLTCYRDGSDLEVRGRLQNAATIAGLGFSNSMAALAHGMGHALGAVFGIPHGRAVALCLPYAIEYCLGSEEGFTRYTPLAKALELPASSEREAGEALARAIRALEDEVGQPRCLAQLGISAVTLEQELELLVENTLNDGQTVLSSRVPDEQDMRRLFRAILTGENIAF
jgi:alcohol dehydrogenase class IV